MSPHANVIVIVPRKSGKMIRFVVCREQNIVTIVSVYPLQWTRRVHDTLAGAVFLCTVGLVKFKLASDTMQDAPMLPKKNCSQHTVNTFLHLFIFTQSQTHIVILEATHTPHSHTCTHTTLTHMQTHAHTGCISTMLVLLTTAWRNQCRQTCLSAK